MKKQKKPVKRGLPLRIMFRAHQELKDTIEAQAKRERRGFGEMIRVLIEDGMAEHKRKGL